MNIYWKKLIYIVKERDRGIAVDAIVIYEKFPVWFKAVDRGPHPEGRIQAVPMQWKHYLRIDLFFAVLTFDWMSGTKIKQYDGN